jgi:hypothetical protein
MRLFATSVWRVTRAAVAVVATLFTLVGCGGTSLRRPLVTDETPLGTPREEVRSWYALNGWCEESRPIPTTRDVVMYRPCGGEDRRRIATVLRFAEDGTLYAAWVYAKVPSPDSTPIRIDMPQTMKVYSGPISIRERPMSPYMQTDASVRRPRPEERDEASEQLVDALAMEIEARHGKGEEVAPFVRSWKTEREWILMYAQGTWVVEAHWPRPSAPR